MNETELEEKAEEVEKTQDKPKEEESAGESPVSPLEEARKLNKETKEMMKLMKDQRALMDTEKANIMLGGRSTAGQTPKPKTQDDKDTEEADKMLGMFDNAP